MNPEIFVKKLIELMGFDDYAVEIDETHRHGKVFIRDNPKLVKDNLPAIIESLNHLVQLATKKANEAPVFFDVNNYRREREDLISELARAAARKVMATKEAVVLPAMNSYERRLIHMELAGHPSVVTESAGSGKDRYVAVKLIEEKSFSSKPTETVSSG